MSVKDSTTIESLLMALSARYLTFDEVLGAYAKKKTKDRNNLLAVHRETRRYMCWCGQNPYSTAEIAEDRVRKSPPTLPESLRAEALDQVVGFV